MKLWKLSNPNVNSRYCEWEGFVVRAETKEKAIELVQQEYVPRNLEEYTCEEVLVDGESSIILSAYGGD